MMNWLWLTTIVAVIDQLTKQLAEQSLSLHQPVPAISNLNWTLMYNEGAAFSFLSDAGGWQRWFFIGLSSAISLFLFFWLKSIPQNKKLLASGLALILGGAIGNLIDRALFGHVIDFIQYYYLADACLPGFSLWQLPTGSTCFWPAFNIADTTISIGAALLVIDMIGEYFSEKNNA
ncbi:MAG: signal peptidase II [Gammaproteobacteria bacterium]|nr:signal peptidase II [Gammaproteobacteria bacterium]MCW8923543.1 signal peptidase II [Gammaproteobacteria bacterium]